MRRFLFFCAIVCFYCHAWALAAHGDVAELVAHETPKDQRRDHATIAARKAMREASAAVVKGATVGWCGPDSAVMRHDPSALPSSANKFPACIYYCKMMEHTCAAVRWVQKTGKCDLMESCSEQRDDVAYGRWIRPKEEELNPLQAVVMSETGQVVQYNLTSEPHDAALPFKIKKCNSALCQHPECPTKCTAHQIYTGERCDLRLKCVPEKEHAPESPGEHYFNCPDEHFGNADWNGPTSEQLTKAGALADLNAPAFTKDDKNSTEKPAKTLREFGFFNVNPDNKGGGRCEKLLQRLPNQQWVLDPDVQLGNIRCFPGVKDTDLQNKLNRMICNKVWVTHPQDTDKGTGMVLFKRMTCIRGSQEDDNWDCSTFKVGACYKCSNEIFSSQHVTPGDQVDFLANCDSPLRCEGQDAAIAKITLMGF